MDVIQFHIEGDSKLRKGFRILFSQKLKKPFNINMAGPRGDAVNQYKRDKAEKKFLIIDLENHPSERETELNKLSLGTDACNTCFMVQKMEAWFIAQADKLFEPEIAEKLGKGNPEFVDKPDQKLKEVLFKHRNKTYDKKGDAINFLQKLDMSELGKKFKDVENLVTNFTN
jgi:hypothetical protein